MSEQCPTPRLTPQEWRILRLVVRGRTNAEIAQFLCTSPATVHNHLVHISEKLNVHGRVQLTRWYLRYYSIDDDDENEPNGP
ncbi:MAG: response regulator transcription factor [Thermomicrobiales bacterium]